MEGLEVMLDLVIIVLLVTWRHGNAEKNEVLEMQKVDETSADNRQLNRNDGDKGSDMGMQMRRNNSIDEVQDEEQEKEKMCEWERLSAIALADELIEACEKASANKEIKQEKTTVKTGRRLKARVTHFQGNWEGRVTNTKGEAFYAIYQDEPTTEEVLEDYRNKKTRKSFKPIV
jgi:hypothetical protein